MSEPMSPVPQTEVDPLAEWACKLCGDGGLTDFVVVRGNVVCPCCARAVAWTMTGVDV
jgi:hypothetical protein